MGVGGRGDHDTVDSRLQQDCRTSSSLHPKPLHSCVDERGYRVVDDERFDLVECAEGCRVERADSAEADQTETHGDLSRCEPEAGGNLVCSARHARPEDLEDALADEFRCEAMLGEHEVI